MKRSSPVFLSLVLAACVGQKAVLNADFSPPTTPAIARSFALRDRYDLAKHIGGTAIFVDSVAVHHIYAEASTIIWKDEAGKWQWSQVSEIGPGGLLPSERRLEYNKSRQLSAADSEALDRLVANPSLYTDKARTSGVPSVGAPTHEMSIVTPFGRATMSWFGRLEGVSGAVADIVLSQS